MRGEAVTPAQLIVAEAACGLAAGVVYAVFTIGNTLWDRSAEPTKREVKLAWLKFFVALFASPLFTVALVPDLLRRFGKQISWPAASVMVGILANAIWPLFVKGFGEETRGYVRNIFKAIRGEGNK